MLRVVRQAALILVASGLSASIPSTARAVTWADGRSTPHLLDLVSIDQTGEARWLFGAEDVAGDGLDTFSAPERALDQRSAYARLDHGRLWLRAYTSSDAAPDAAPRVFFFLDTDADANTGGHASAPPIDAALTRDDSPGGYDAVIGLQSGTALAGVWQWNSIDAAYVPADVQPFSAVPESGVDVDPLRLFAGEHGYLQVSVAADALELASSCGANLLVRSTNSNGSSELGAGDLDVGRRVPCVALDRDANRVPDLLEAADVAPCDSDDQCPASGLCLSGHCLYPGYCRANADCASGERCNASGLCVAEGGASCSGDVCAGGLVCKNSACRACQGDADCGGGERCAPSGRCVDGTTPSGSSDSVLEPEPDVPGGAGGCGIGAITARTPGRLLLPLLLGVLALLGLARRGLSARHQ
jgi:hypothetical protein